MKSLSYFGESDFKVNTLKDFEKFVDSQYLKGTTYFLPQYKFLTKKLYYGNLKMDLMKSSSNGVISILE